MALSKAALSSLMQSKISAVANITSPAELASFCDALADAIVSHITSAAVVTATGVDPQGGSVASTGTVS